MSKKRLDLQMFADASAQLQNTTGAAGMTAEMKTYYEKTLLDAVAPVDGEPMPVSQLPAAIGTVIGTVQDQLYDDVVALDELAELAACEEFKQIICRVRVFFT